MDCSKMNEYIIHLLEEKKLTLTSLAKSLKMNVDELADALSSNINIELYDKIAEVLNVSIDTIILCKKKGNKKFIAKFETAIKNGPSAIASLKNQGTNLFEPDSYGTYLIEYAMDANALDSFSYILENNGFHLADDNYLKKHPLLSTSDKELYFRVLIYILKYQLSKHYYLVSKFGVLNHGLFRGFSDEYRYIFLYYLNKNKMDIVLDLVFSKKYYKMKLFKIEDDILSYSTLADFVIEYRLNYLASYLGRNMIDFKTFISHAHDKDYDEGIKIYLEASDYNFLSQAKNYAQDMQKIYVQFCKEGNLDVVSILLNKKYYVDMNEGLDMALTSNQVSIYQNICQNHYEELNKDKALISACKSENEEVVKMVLKDTTQEGKNNGLKEVKNSAQIMSLLIEEGAYFQNSEDTFKQISVLLHYLIKGGK